MKKKIIKIIVLLAGVLLFAVGCGNDGVAVDSHSIEAIGNYDVAEDTEKTTDAMESEDVPSWSISHTALEGSYELATVSGDKIYGCYYTDDGMKVSIFDISMGENQGNYEIPGVTEVQSITADYQNQICIYGATEKGSILWQIGQDGKISTIENIEVEDLGKFPSLKAFFADCNGHYYLWYEMTVPCVEVYEDGEENVYTILDRIYVKDQQMNTICYEQIPGSNFNKLLSLLIDEDGTPVLLAQDADGYYMRRVRTEEREEYEQCRIEETELNEQGIGDNIASTQKGLLYTRDGALYLYHMKEGREEKLLELASGGVYEEDIIYLGIRGDTIEIIDNYQGSERSEYTTFEPGESRQVQLSLGVMTLEPDMREIITAFNRYQNEVKIEPIIYVEGYDYDAGYEKLKLDMVQGKAPDLISTNGIDYEILANAGAFMDLYEFMEKDPECSREMFLSSVLEAYELREKLYTVAPTFRLYTMWGGSSLVQGRYGVDMKELIQILRANGGDINNIYGFSADESVLRTLCSLGMNQFINWEDATCDFTSMEFRQILEFVKEYRGTQIDSLYLATQEGEVMLTLGLISSVEDYCLQSELYGENVEFIGYPTGQGSGSVVLFTGSALAINAKTEYSREAWEFIKFYLLHGYDGTGFPVVTEQFENVLSASKEEMMTEEEGQSYRVAKKHYAENGIISIQIYTAEQEDVDVIRQLVESATGKFQYYNTVQNIIDEEAEAYFRDQKTLDQVTEIIQNRVQLYLYEK